jgi:hypothetical protein
MIVGAKGTPCQIFRKRLIPNETAESGPELFAIERLPVRLCLAWNETINTENLSLIAEMLTRSALAREESRGAHYRSDFPTQKLDWLKNIRMKVLADGDFEMAFTPVEFTRLTPQELKEHRERAGLKTLPAIDDE